MSRESELEQQRSETVEAIDWIDAERKRLSRHCFSETRKNWHGEKERGRKITLMKKESEWLYRQRCRLRKRMGSVNAALKEARKARNGTVSESFGSTFVGVAREKLPGEVFAAVLDETTKRYGSHGKAAVPETADGPALTVLEELKRALAEFRDSNARPSPRTQTVGRRESQADFGLAAISGNRRVFSDYAR